MPRIGGGGKPPPGVPPRARGVPKSQPSDFAKVQTAQTQGTSAARAEQAKHAERAERSERSHLTERAKQIAKRLAKGTVNPREATQAFVALVIEQRFPQLKKKKRGKGDRERGGSPEEQLEEAVTDLIDQDPALAKQLMDQFNKLAAKD